MKHYLKRYRFKFIRYCMDIVYTDQSMTAVAFAFAVGTFIALLPLPVLNTLMGLSLILLFRKVNKVAILLPLIIWNTLTLIPVYWLSAYVGNRLFEDSEKFYINFALWNVDMSYTLRFLVGHLLVSFALSLLSYVALFKLVTHVRIMRAHRKMYKKQHMRPFVAIWRNKQRIAGITHEPNTIAPEDFTF